MRLYSSRLAPSIVLSLIAVLLTTLVTPSPLAAGTTGKIAGTVKDAKTNEPLAGASVVIEGSRLGARTDADGNYTILNVAPGKYRVRASYVGYQPQTVGNISIRADFTSRVEFDLSAEGVVAKEVSVTAERPLIIKDQTSTVAVVTAEQIRALPVENFDQVVSLQAGVVDGRFRGGRLGEVAYIVDGVAVQDVFDGGKGGARTVEPAAIQELQVITGAFNAEYGQALSGVVSIVTKDGGTERLAGNLTVYTGSYFSARSEIFQNITALNPVSSPNIQGSLGGPVPGFGEKLTFFVSGRGFYNEGYFFGTRQYRPTDVLSQNNPDNPFGLSRTNDALPAIRGYFVPGGAPGSANTYTFRDKTGNPYIGADGQPLTVATGPDGKAIIDRQNGMPMYIPYYVVGRDRDGVLGVLNNYQNLGTGDGKTVPLAPFTRYSGQGKLTFRPFERLKISANALYENETSQGYDIGFSRNPGGNSTGYREGLTAYLTTNFTLSS
ncbi:MAG: carboxypeptidase regulatory-like domain-containing protein, partial [Rhizobacter sp.]|nr:carboxypeptidase regulatory-like domain-containing protein [Chlorobiales bacterium]